MEYKRIEQPAVEGGDYWFTKCREVGTYQPPSGKEMFQNSHYAGSDLVAAMDMCCHQQDLLVVIQQ
jgi:hypothetical protein